MRKALEPLICFMFIAFFCTLPTWAGPAWFYLALTGTVFSSILLVAFVVANYWLDG